MSTASQAAPITITVYGGTVQGIENIAPGQTVLVKDYDCDYMDSDLETDADGHSYRLAPFCGADEAPLRPAVNDLTASQIVERIREITGDFHDATETLQTDWCCQLVYFLGAIAMRDQVYLDPESEYSDGWFYAELRKLYPLETYWVWDHTLLPKPETNPVK